MAKLSTARPGALLFDLDGTLVDSAPDLAQAANRLLTEHGRPPLPLEALRPMASQGARGMLRVAFGLTPEHLAYATLTQRFLDHYAAHLCEQSGLFPGVAALLDHLDALALPWGVVTNKHGRFTEPLLRELGLYHRAACVVPGNAAPHPKPAPDLLLLACQQLRQAPGACVYVGDDPRDVAAGKAAGLGTVAVSYGYPADHPPAHTWGADHCIDHPSKLLEILGILPKAC